MKKTQNNADKCANDNTLDFFELAAKYKAEYYRNRPIMRFFNTIGLDRGIKSRGTQYAIEMAKRDLGIGSVTKNGDYSQAQQQTNK